MWPQPRGCCWWMTRIGAEALALLDSWEDVDVLVTDLSMPGLNGLDVIRAAQERWPALPAVLLTGYSGDGVETGTGSNHRGQVLGAPKAGPDP